MDATIANTIANPASIKLDDPLERYGNFLKVQHLNDEIRSARRAEEDAVELGNAYREKGDNENEVVNYLAKKGLGRLIPDIRKKGDERRKSAAEVGHIDAQTGEVKAKTQGTQAETINKKYQFIRDNVMNRVSTDPVVGLQQLNTAYGMIAMDNLVGPYMKSLGWTPDKSKQMAAEAAKNGTFADYVNKERISADKLAENHITSLDLGGHHQLVSTSKYGTPNPKVVSDQKVTASPNANKGTSVTVVNQPAKAGNVFTEEVSKGRAADFLKLESAARAGRAQVTQIDEAIRLLNDGAFVGALGNAAMDVTRYAKALGIPVNDQKIINSQQLRKLLKQGMLNYLAQLKASGTTMNPFTDADARRLEATLANENDEPGTIRDALMMQRRIVEGIEKDYREYAQQANQNPMTSGGMGATNPPSSSGLPPANVRAHSNDAGFAKNVALLRKNRNLAAKFDEWYGPGAAAQVLGGASNQGRPFPAGAAGN